MLWPTLYSKSSSTSFPLSLKFKFKKAILEWETNVFIAKAGENFGKIGMYKNVHVQNIESLIQNK